MNSMRKYGGIRQPPRTPFDAVKRCLDRGNKEVLAIVSAILAEERHDATLQQKAEATGDNNQRQR